MREQAERSGGRLVVDEDDMRGGYGSNPAKGLFA
jgi:hypothetical protein